MFVLTTTFVLTIVVEDHDGRQLQPKWALFFSIV